MSETDAPGPRPRDLIRAVQLLTRLPVPGGDGTRGAAAAWAWPVVGAGVALIQISVGLAALALGLPAPVAAGVALGAGVVVTGGLHEDGLADCADGFWGGMTRTRRLEILKDSRIGSYGVLGLIVSMGLRWALFAALLPVAPLALLAAAMISRAGMAAMMGWMAFARTDGIAAHIGRPPVWAVSLAIGLALIGGGAATGIAALPAILLAAVAMWAVGSFARAKIGGQTGDVLGATQVVGEIAALMALAAALT